MPGLPVCLEDGVEEGIGGEGGEVGYGEVEGAVECEFEGVPGSVAAQTGGGAGDGGGVVSTWGLFLFIAHGEVENAGKGKGKWEGRLIGVDVVRVDDVTSLILASGTETWRRT